MAEYAPGLFVSPIVKPGAAYVLDLDAIGVGSGKGIAMSEEDWNNIDPGEREELVDKIVRGDAQRGVRELERMLAAHGA